MSDVSDNNDELVAGIFGGLEYGIAELKRREFRPWHRPRKQFVRREQWAKQVRGLYADRPPTDPLRYLGLPGTDLIDLRYLHDEVCRPADRPLIFLGFNSEAQPNSPARDELNISLYEVGRLPNVQQRQSDVIHDDFRRISDESSIAWKRARAIGPFDVVNLDLCDGLASDSPTIRQSIYDALGQVTALQSHSLTPWLLLITTRIGPRMFDPNAEAAILQRFRDNVGTCDGFIEECQQHLGLNATAIEPSTCSDLDYLKLMIVALGKWLAELVQASRSSQVVLASTLGYRVVKSAPCEDLVSIALRCEPIFSRPANALSPTPPQPFDECKTAKRIVRRAARRKDIDSILKADSDVHEGLVVEMEGLLTAARYDVERYRPWLESLDSGL
ncbi:PP_RS20740 family protein [Candidatus Poriferisodalis sp.]|uniref:PP_RS20740 family protein n=1 Tax=Candidatus Poriferisodalis sp. TaxID=3101277 RepID=UPI003B02981B